MTETIRIGRHVVEITHPEKLLFSRPPVSKLALARQYEAVAAVMLPHVRGRPLALEAYPQGVDSHGFLP
jgi:bifunctional non-homologous end joining protein LigD